MPTPLPSRLRLLVFGATLWSLVPDAALAQQPAPVAREALLRLVPDDVALCLVVTDLRTQGDKLMKSPWVKALKDAPFAKALGDAPELLKLTEVRKQIQKHLQIDWNQLRDEILGDAVVFAYRPALPGQAEKEACLLLLQARNPGLLKLLIDRLNQDQKRTGDLKDLKTRDYKGLTYFGARRSAW